MGAGNWICFNYFLSSNARTIVGNDFDAKLSFKTVVDKALTFLRFLFIQVENT